MKETLLKGALLGVFVHGALTIGGLMAASIYCDNKCALIAAIIAAGSAYFCQVFSVFANFSAARFPVSASVATILMIASIAAAFCSLFLIIFWS